MICGKCRMCVVEKEFVDELPDGNDYTRLEIVPWNEGDKEKPFCIMQDLYTNVDPEKDCCNSDVKRFAIAKKEGKNEKNNGPEKK
ncbi:MAG: hypothetical protein MJZ37_00895 [Bacilli bacterium]|nr:hypothetical protein [Bacilli bacterium]